MGTNLILPLIPGINNGFVQLHRLTLLVWRDWIAAADPFLLFHILRPHHHSIQLPTDPSLVITSKHVHLSTAAGLLEVALAPHLTSPAVPLLNKCTEEEYRANILQMSVLFRWTGESFGNKFIILIAIALPCHHGKHSHSSSSASAAVTSSSYHIATHLRDTVVHIFFSWRVLVPIPAVISRTGYMTDYSSTLCGTE